MVVYWISQRKVWSTIIWKRWAGYKWCRRYFTQEIYERSHEVLFSLFAIEILKIFVDVRVTKEVVCRWTRSQISILEWLFKDLDNVVCMLHIYHINVIFVYIIFRVYFMSWWLVTTLTTCPCNVICSWMMRPMRISLKSSLYASHKIFISD